MTYKVLSLKWRPSTFKEVVGQDHITISLSNAIKLGRVAHAFTFSGPRGVGKTTTARILSKELNEIKDLSESLDVIEMDAASNRGIDEIRNINDNVNFAPSHGKYKIYIIDEVHMLTKEAFNALLKTLEEPPNHVVFILCTTESHKIPTTILSRTQRYDFKKILDLDIINQLKKILDDEKINYEEGSLEIIAERSEGSMRDALSLLDQMICLCDNNLTINTMKEHLGLVEESKCLELLQLVGKKDTKKIFNLINDVLNKGVSTDEFIKTFNKFLSKSILLTKKEKDNLNINITEIDLLRIIDITLKFQSSLKNSIQPKIAFEALMLKLSHIDKMIDISKFISNENLDIKEDEINNDDRSNDSTSQILKKNDSTLKEGVFEESENDNDKLLNPTKDNLNDDLVSGYDNNSSKVEVMTLEKIVDSWPKVLKLIESKNKKTANFLFDSTLDDYTDGKLLVKVNNISKFAFKGLLNDLVLIEEQLSVCLKEKVRVSLSEGELQKIESSKQSDNKDEDHPLFMNVLNKFEGEVLR